MKLLCVLLVACLALAAADDDHDHHDECPSLSGDKLAKLKSHVVTEDVHDLVSTVS